MVYTATVPRPLVVPALPTIPLKAIAPWVMFAASLLLALYFVGADQGATSLVPGHMVHEFVHDARHLLGVPCH
jgi:ABC-type spermidine/putrescine transport system permease subunit II